MKHSIEIDGEKITFDASDNDAEFVGSIVTSLLTGNGFVNLDAEDIVSILDGAEKISVGEGISSGDDRVRDAALEAVRNTAGASDAKSLLVCVTSGLETFLSEIAEASYVIEGECISVKNIIWGHVLDESIGDDVRVSIIAID